jgi:cytochrome c553
MIDALRVCRWCALLGLAMRATAATAEPSFDQAAELVRGHCLECHQADEPEAGLDLSGFTSPEAVAAQPRSWRKVLRRLRAGEMPPEDAEPLALEDREALAAWVEGALRAAACSAGSDPGPSPLRRLNRTEYRTTIRDLLGIHFDAGHALPADGAGGEGFDNAAETLFLSPVHGEKYLEAAREALEYAAKDSRARALLLVAAPSEQLSQTDAARQILERFATRAFRRPVAADELESLLGLFAAASERGEPFDQAVFFALQSVLIAPQFLFRFEEPVAGNEPRPVGDYELATRLSYFLWSSLPDDELLRLAGEGKLHDDAVLRQQVLRMLDDDKLRGLAEGFASQWLGTGELGTRIKPDPKLFRRYDEELESAMREEPILVFQEILAKNRSLLDLLQADFTYVNKKLARHYGLDDDDVKRKLEQRPVRVRLPAGHPRGGVLTMGGVLAVTSFPHRTSPVLRGKWVLETLLGASLPPPPPDAGELAETDEGAAPRTLRERLLAHRRDAKCAACHERLDPLGFALEHYDAVGRWRDEDAGQPIDSRGELPGGIVLGGAGDLKQAMLARQDEFVRHLAGKLLGYALGRGLVDADQCTIDALATRLAAHDYAAQELILGIVESVPFRQRRPDSVDPPQAAEPAAQETGP